MAELKIDKNKAALDVIPDVPAPSNNSEASTSENYVKTETNDGRKLFQNKKANIAFGIIGGILLVLIIAAVIFINV